MALFYLFFHWIFLWGDHGMQNQLMVWLGYDMITGWCVLLRWLDPKDGAPDSQVGLINLIYAKLLGATGRCLTTLLVRAIILSPPKNETPARNHAGCILGGWDSNQGIMSQLGGYHLLENPNCTSKWAGTYPSGFLNSYWDDPESSHGWTMIRETDLP